MTKIYSKAKSNFFLFFLLVGLGISYSAGATIYPFSATYSGANEVPPNASTATGTIIGTYNDVNNTIYYTITFSGLTNNASGAHFHAPAAPGVNASVIHGYTGFPAATSGTYTGSHVFTDQQETYLKDGLVYSNIHDTPLFAGGEIRAQIILGAASTTILSFNRTYSGANEVPANSSIATGTISGTYDPATNRIFYAINYSGLSGNVSGAHFHTNSTPGINGPVTQAHTGFPTTTSGAYTNTHIVTADQEPLLLGGRWYSNIHTSPDFLGGEIRAQIFFNEIAAPTSITCPTSPITVSNAPGLCSQTVSFSATATGEPTPALFYRIGSTAITSPRSFPVGTTGVTATAINGGGYLTCAFNVVVNDTEAPVIHNLAASPDKLWSPNHKMKDITVSYHSTDNCGVPITCSLTITSNEAVNGKGDGNTTPDWVVMDDHHVQLRAERSGKGSDRVYTITTTCTDQYGNSSQSATTVKVPHDNRSSARMTTEGNAMAAISGLKLGILDNPSRNHFTLNIQTDNNTEKMTVRVFDLQGRMLESKANLRGSQFLKLGSDLQAGFYIVELTQGKQKTQLKLLKSK